eukprot:CAMPEP_0202965386 /NCGR_PEP_ID=MMETSP1396-20130829/9377_1 /ASSEMBLY_ACC=CAM_ASM_000872 /TAXON_ID= /ORGANISM="Pseudokeronopsis sp., Strain Brazil" /LENGTH=74 /DNA_ID=CAMNT_0049688077 /DNA_START=714 /DNA_END=939 /DNA_ORIENTATION=+
MTHIPLPQFGFIVPEDINAKLGLDGNYEGGEVVYETDPNLDLEELRGVKRNYDESLTIPFHFRDKNEMKTAGGT